VREIFCLLVSRAWPACWLPVHHLLTALAAGDAVTDDCQVVRCSSVQGSTGQTEPVLVHALASTIDSGKRWADLEARGSGLDGPSAVATAVGVLVIAEEQPAFAERQSSRHRRFRPRTLEQGEDFHLRVQTHNRGTRKGWAQERPAQCAAEPIIKRALSEAVPQQSRHTAL
jgi:hypothetical protein